MAKEIQLTCGKVTLVSDCDYEFLSQFKWYYYPARGRSPEEAKTNVKLQNGKWTRKYIHQLIAKRMGVEGIMDHINHNRLDNRRENLRPATNSQNGANSRKRTKPCSSRFKGVCWDKAKKKWKAHIRVNRKRFHLGYFHNEWAAAQAYNFAAIYYFGEYAYLNKLGDNCDNDRTSGRT
jgi:hypothetical protein